MSDWPRNEIRFACDKHPYRWTDFVEYYGKEAKKRWDDTYYRTAVDGYRYHPTQGSRSFDQFVEHFRSKRVRWPVSTAWEQWKSATTTDLQQQSQENEPSQDAERARIVKAGAAQHGDQLPTSHWHSSTSQSQEGAVSFASETPAVPAETETCFLQHEHGQTDASEVSEDQQHSEIDQDVPPQHEIDQDVAAQHDEVLEAAGPQLDVVSNAEKNPDPVERVLDVNDWYNDGVTLPQETLPETPLPSWGLRNLLYTDDHVSISSSIPVPLPWQFEF